MQESAPMSRLGDRIKYLRERRELSRAELARRSRLSGPTIGRIEEGASPTPKLETLERIAKALGVHHTDLTDGTTPERGPLPQSIGTALDVDKLTEALEKCCSFLEVNKLHPSARTTAEMVVWLYSYALQHGPMDEEAFERFMRLVLQRS